MTSLKRVVWIGLALLSLSMSSVGQVVISVGFAPPALPIYEQPICPGEGYIWTPGYWSWDPDFGDYYWVPGTWVLAPEVGFLWTPPWWGWVNGAWIFHDGWWGPHVGFYGGINYGFGYFGTGFWGGRWEGGHFFYNRSVTNINVVNIHNVYNENINRTVVNNHVSFNGGPGGINARVTGDEERAFHERHVGPSPEQTRNFDAARGNQQLRASVNHGRPAVAATARPGEFNGREAVPAREAGGEYRGKAGGGGGGGGSYGHARDLPPMERPAAPNTGNAKADRKYQQQQDKLFAHQQQERQKLEQQQEREHQQMQRQQANNERQQQMEQRHQQQTQQMQERHSNEMRNLQSHSGGGGEGKHR